jgi:hypothetical protein
MNQRRENRFSVNQQVEVLVFGSPDLRLEGTIRNASGRGIGLLLPERLGIGKTLRIKLVDSILLGEVIYCRAQDGGWDTGVQLEHALFGLAQLAEALRGFAEDASGAEQQHAVHNTRRQSDQ